MRLQLVAPIYQYLEKKKIDYRAFCVITYKNPFRYFFENKLDNEMVTKKTTWLKENNVTHDIIFETKRNSINVKKISKFIAVSDKTTVNE